MITNEKAKMWAKRIVALVIVGGLMFLMMNCAGPEKLRKEEGSSLFSDCTPAGTWYGEATTRIMLVLSISIPFSR